MLVILMAQEDLLMGKEAPAFCLPDPECRKTCLEEFRGKWAVLYFYPKDNTPGCTLEALQFNKEMAVFEGSDATIIGVSPDSPESHQNFKEKHHLGFILLSDADHRVLKAYGVWEPKMLFGKELFGVVRSTFLIDPRGKIVDVWRRVKVPGHSAAVLVALDKRRTQPEYK